MKSYNEYVLIVTSREMIGKGRHIFVLGERKLGTLDCSERRRSV